ncbi:hypothetical protein C0Q70_20168 [Pomacea canaliculata]|uniref:Uncharacterized protein n=1 Tax=Pomacea canaliculata TaxID=400727 RepID=A0A2T7NES2_POMCA|nr:hypothetical protein C0Q70_20168 [Pomacea canaliculata]
MLIDYISTSRSTSVSVSSSTDSEPDGSHDTCPQHPCVRLASASFDCGRYRLHTLGKQGVFLTQVDCVFSFPTCDVLDPSYVAGSWYTHTGSGANYLCLPPDFVASNVTKPYYVASLYGAEYKVSTRAENDHDAVCAVCFVKTRSVNIMVPGTNKCPTGWSSEYTGFLMSGYDSYAGSRSTSVWTANWKAASPQALTSTEGSCTTWLACVAVYPVLLT